MTELELPPLAHTFVERSVDGARAALAEHGVAADDVRPAEELVGVPGILPLRVRAGGTSAIVIAMHNHDDVPIIVGQGAARRARPLPRGWRALLIAELERTRAALPRAQTALLDEVAPFTAARRLDDEFFEVEAERGTLLVFAGWNDAGRITHLSFGAGFGAVERACARTPVAFAVAPVGEPFRVIWGGPTAATNYHHRTRQQRFAVDLEPFTSAPVAVRAPVAARVLAAADGEPEDVARDDPRRLRHPFGNRVVLDAGGAHVHFAHLARGSVRVAVGDLVAPGDVLGAIGDSGRSSRRHLHVHATSALAPHHAVPFAWSTGERVRPLRRGDVVR